MCVLKSTHFWPCTDRMGPLQLTKKPRPGSAPQVILLKLSLARRRGLQRRTPHSPHMSQTLAYPNVHRSSSDVFEHNPRFLLRGLLAFPRILRPAPAVWPPRGNEAPADRPGALRRAQLRPGRARLEHLDRYGGSRLLNPRPQPLPGERSHFALLPICGHFPDEAAYPLHAACAPATSFSCRSCWPSSSNPTHRARLRPVKRRERAKEASAASLVRGWQRGGGSVGN